jgi:hypothetical protein
MEVQIHRFLTLALDGSEWSALCLSHFTPRERAHGTHCIGGWVSLRISLDAVAKNIPFLPLPEIEP